MVPTIQVRGRQVKLGRLPQKFDSRTLQAAKYMKAVSPPPLAVDNVTQVPTVMMYANDTIGDCTFASKGHAVGLWTYDATSNEFIFTDQQIVKGYSDVSGYNPNTGANDNGCNMLDVLNYLRKTGIGGHKIVAFVSLDPNDTDQIKQAINLFGGVDAGFDVPQYAVDQFDAGQMWDISSKNTNLVGGHDVFIGKYDANTLTCFSWAEKQKMTWRFFSKFFSEVYAIVTPDWLNANWLNPQGLSISTLETDLVAVGNKQPTPGPTPIPVPTPVPTPPGCLSTLAKYLRLAAVDPNIAIYKRIVRAVLLTATDLEKSK